MSISAIRKSKLPYKGGPGAVGIRFDPTAKVLKYHNGSVETTLPGFAAGAGGAVTQATSAATAVTLNKPTGRITTVALTTAAGAEEQFTVNNSQVAATDVIVLSTTYAGAGTPMLSVSKVGAGVFDIVITNAHATNALNAAMGINFVVIKGANS